MNESGSAVRLSARRGDAHGLLGDLVVLALVLIVLVTVSALTVSSILAVCEGQLIYGLDDAYIHAGIARNAVETRTWGITPHNFSSSSSAPLWTALLAVAFEIVGPDPIVIGLLEALSAIGLIVLLWALLRNRLHSRVAPAAALIAAAAGMPLVWQMAIGMEHVLQAALTLGLLAACTALVTNRQSDASFWSAPGRRWLVNSLLCVLSALCATIRYEGLFAVAAVAVVLWLRSERGLSVATAAAGLLPVLAIGVQSTARGWFFLPNSVVLKGNMPTGQGIVYAATKLVFFGAYKLVQNPFLLLMVAFAICVVISTRRRGESWSDSAALPAVLFLAVTFGQLQFAGTGLFLTRYAAYLVPIGVWAIAPWIEQSLLGSGTRPRTLLVALSVGAALLLGLLGQRGVQGSLLAPRAAADIYRQQWQMGRFLSGHGSGGTVAVNDIGAVSFWGVPHLLDLWGLADVDVARAMKRGLYGPDIIEQRAESTGAQIAVVSPRGYDEWGGLPTTWQQVAVWTLEHPTILNPDVGFYAIEPESAGPLEAALRAFEPTLPEGVRVSYGSSAGDAQ